MKILITLLLLTVCALAQTQRPMGQEWFQQEEYGQPMGLEDEEGDEFGQWMYQGQGGQTLEIGQEEDEDIMYQQGAAAEVEEEDIPIYQGQAQEEPLIMQEQLGNIEEEPEALEMEQGQELEIEQGQGILQERQPRGGFGRDFRFDLCERSCFRRHRRCAPCARRCIRDCFRFNRHRRDRRGGRR